MKILIATPTYDGKVDARYHVSVVRSLRLLGADHFVEMLVQQGIADLGHARDLAVQYAIDIGADVIMWADADTYWEPQVFKRLLDSDKDFIGAFQRKKHEKLEASSCSPVDAPVDADGVVEGLVLGFGLCKMTSRCFKRLHEVTQPYTYNNKPAHRIFQFGIDQETGILAGEDASACLIWQALGEKVWLDTHAPVGHVSYSTVFEWPVA